MNQNPPLGEKSLVRPWQWVSLAFVAVILGMLYIVSHPQIVINSYISGKITQAIHEAYPEYTIQIAHLRYHILENRLDCDSLSMMKSDGSEEFTIVTMSVSGVDRWQLFRGRGISTDLLGNARASVQGVTMTGLRPRYVLHCAVFNASVPDSQLLIQSLDVQPEMDDEEFFEQSPWRNTLLRLAIVECSVTGVECVGFLRGIDNRAKIAHIVSPSLTVLLNKDKPSKPNSPPPMMPGDFFTSIDGPFHLDSIDIIDGSIYYGERFAVLATPALLTCDNMHVAVTGLGNVAGGSDTVHIQTEGTFQEEGSIGLNMAIPVSSPDLSYSFNGFLEHMNAQKLNSFIEIAESKRAKSGKIQSVRFTVDVHDGKATGLVRATYTDFKIEVIDAHTQRRGGIFNDVISFIANTFKLRTSNVPDKSGVLKAGVVKFTKHDNETFLQFSWFSLRSGLKDLVGF